MKKGLRRRQPQILMESTLLVLSKKLVAGLEN